MLLLFALASQAAPPAPVVVKPPMQILTRSVPRARAVPQPGLRTSARSAASLANYITPDDYPAEAIRRGEQGTTAIRLDVGRDGRVTACTVTASSGSAALDSATCRLMRSRPRFTPAVDLRGKPAEDQVTARIRWQLPARVVPDFAVTRFEIAADGSVRNCRMSVSYHGEKERTVENPTCDRPGPPQRLVDALRAQSFAEVSRARQQLLLIRDAGAPWPAAAGGSERVVAEARARLLVEPGGKVTSCTMLDTSSLLGAMPQPCNGVQAITDDGIAATREMRLILQVVLDGEPAPR